jgi:DNA-binding PadR family transcriptional regulator
MVNGADGGKDAMAAGAEKTKWMRGPSTPLRGALLGLLLERPGHGGDLANRLSVRLGETWRVDTNDVYRLLEQLERTGLASAREEPKRGNGLRTHLVYHPTAATPGALALWIETRLPREPVRLGLQAKLAVARRQDAQRLLIALEAYERECLVLAHIVQPGDGSARSWAALCMDCARDGAHVQLRAEADWAGRTARRIRLFTAGGRSDAPPSGRRRLSGAPADHRAGRAPAGRPPAAAAAPRRGRA